MKKFFNEANILIKEEQIEKFNIYKELLIEYNAKFNLTAILEEDEIYKKHFVDSVTGLEKVKGKVIDIGSGGGFPAIPLKIMNDDLDVTMLEATEKKCFFLNVVIEKLNLKNIRVINGRAEELAKNENLRESFDTCTARAVARLNTLCEYCMPFVKVGGNFVAFKGDVLEELNEAKNAINVLGGKLKENNSFELFNQKRSITVIEKIKSTPKVYPRGRGKERKSPL